MQLYYSQTSPFARKVAMFLHFTNMIDECELVLTSFDNDELREKNPLGKIPALIHGELALFESDLICEYLDDLWAMNGQHSLFHRGSQHYYLEQKALRQANGATEAAVSLVMENRRDTEPNPYWTARWHTAIEQSLKTLDLAYCGSADKPNMATFALASALGYLDFRHPFLDWRSWRAELHTWFDEIRDTPWFSYTSPPEA